MISILIPTYNYIVYPLVESLTRQAEELGTPCEIIVADDASTNEECKQANLRIGELPHCTFIELEKNIGRASIRNLLAEKAKELGAEMIVVGLPKNMDGTEGFKAKECTEAAEALKEKTGLPVELWDERCTTVSAHTALNYTDTRGKKRKQVVDAVAATIILEDFLRRRQNSI